MGYVGRGLNQDGGQYRKLDSIATSFNGSETNFTLTIDGLEVTPTAQNLMISLGGVVQEPGTAFTVNGSTITFASAPADATTFFGVLMGEATFIARGTVGAAEMGITAGAVSASAGVVVDSSKNVIGFNEISASIFKGSFSGDTSSSINTRINSLVTDSGSFSTRITNATASINSISSSQATRTANLVIASSSLSASVATLKGSGTLQSVATNASPTFAGATITGTLTAQEIHTEFESASIIFSSGSTLFGNSSDDVHDFKGNTISGSVTSTGSFGRVHIGASSVVIEDNGSGALGFRTNNAERFSVASNGPITFAENVNIDASRTLTVNGDLDVDGTANLDVVDIDGAVDMASTLTLGGRLTLSNAGSDPGLFLGGGWQIFDNASESYGTAGDLVFFHGASRMVVGDTGLVGIGTTDPSGSLHISNTGTTVMYLEGDSNNSGQEDAYIKFVVDGQTQEAKVGWDNNNSTPLFNGNTENSFVVGCVSNLPIVFATNNTERMQIAADGSVGIHTTSPNVGSYNSERGVLTIGSTDNGSANNYANLELQGHAIANDVTIGDISWFDHTNQNAIVRGGRDSSSTTGFLSFFTNGGSGVGERMRIDKDGHVAIGGDVVNRGSMNKVLEVHGTSDVEVSITATDELIDDQRIGQFAFYTDKSHYNMACIIGRVSGTDENRGELTFHTRYTETGGTPAERWRMKSTGTFEPGTNNAVNLGASDKRVSVIYTSNSVNVSDRTLKENITASDLGLTFIDTLQPKSFNMKDLTEAHDDYGRRHHGLIAQDLLNTPLSGSVFGDKDGEYSLAYNDLIGPMIKAIQELSTEVQSLKAQVSGSN